MGINQRVSLRKFIEDIRRWVDEGRSDDWIASALGTSPSSVQSFRSRNAIYRRGAGSTLHDPQDYSSYEGVLEPSGPGVWFDPEVGNDPRWQKRWSGTERVELRLTPTRLVLLRRGGREKLVVRLVRYNRPRSGRPTRRCVPGLPARGVEQSPDS